MTDQLQHLLIGLDEERSKMDSEQADVKASRLSVCKDNPESDVENTIDDLQMELRHWLIARSAVAPRYPSLDRDRP